MSTRNLHQKGDVSHIAIGQKQTTGDYYSRNTIVHVTGIMQEVDDDKLFHRKEVIGLGSIHE